MLFREALQKVPGFREIMDRCLKIQSPVGVRRLYAAPFMASQAELEAEFGRMKDIMARLSGGTMEGKIAGFGLGQLRDIKDILERLRNDDILNDIELFEIKNLAFLAGEVKREMEKYGLAVVDIPSLLPVVEMLDPEHSGIRHFYIYNTYSEELALVRAEIRNVTEREVEEALRSKEKNLEEAIRSSLSCQLQTYEKELSCALEGLGQLDVLLAKTRFAVDFNLTCPVIADDTIAYEGLWNISVKRELERQGLEYQRVDIRLGEEATVITGANMSGKSLLLKSLLLAQYMAQFGFYVPAAKAGVALVDEVFICTGDDQNEQKGLSSYAAEMLKINEVVGSVKRGKKVLALIDEPARTTNPVEGVAIVNALVNFLTVRKVLGVLTTHYSGLEAPCRRLRIKGFAENRVEGKLLPGNINRYIDYSLEESDREQVPQEALRIAAMLGVDRDLLEEAGCYLRKADQSVRE